MVKIKIETIFDGDEELILIGDVYEPKKKLWMVEHFGLNNDNCLKNSNTEVESYQMGFKINSFELPSSYFCSDKNRTSKNQSYPIIVTWISDLDEVKEGKEF